MELALLGRFELRCCGREVELPRKTRGLLAYLSLHRQQRVGRDRLAALLWGARGTQQARQSLRQALTSLRIAFGEPASSMLSVEKDSLVFQPFPHLLIDIDRFLPGPPASDLPTINEMTALWRGPFLADLDIQDAAFEDWLAIERERFAQAYSDLLFRQANMLLDEGNVDSAVRAARILVQHDSFREEGHRLLMAGLIKQGHRNLAVQHYDSLAKLLDSELGIKPDGQTRLLAEQARGADDVVPPTIIPDFQYTVLPRPKKPSIAVLPFRNLTGDAKNTLLVDGLVEDLTGALGREKWLFVIASPSTASFSGDESDIREAGRQLGVDYVLRGSVRRSESTMRIVAMLSDAVSGEFIATHQVEGETSQLFELADRLTSLVSARIGPELRSVEISRVSRKPTNNLSAYEHYLRALPLFRASLENNHRALVILDQAIQLDPTFAAAHALVARCYQFQRMLGWVGLDDPGHSKGLSFAHRASDLGQSDAEALWMASHALSFLGGEIDHAVELIERAIALNPSSANCWTTSCSVQTMLGNPDVAVSHFETSRRLNPLDRSHHLHWNIVGLAYFALGRLDDADAAADRALRINPDYQQALRLKISVLGRKGFRSDAAPFLTRLLELHPDFSLGWLATFWAKPMKLVPELYAAILSGAEAAGTPP